MFYARGVVETVKKLRWDPTLIHCSGWVSAMAPLYLKCAYADDPSFANSKIVYSVFDSKFDGTLDPRLQEKLKLDGFSDSDIAALGDKPVDIISLHKLAIDHSDAVAQSSPEIPQEVLDYIKASGKPFLPYPGDTDYVEKYAEFYKSL